MELSYRNKNTEANIVRIPTNFSITVYLNIDISDI